MRELDHKEGWTPNNWCFWTAVLLKTLESPMDFKEIKPVHPKGNQSWMFIGRTDAEAEVPILWPPEELTHWKRPWHWERQEEKGVKEDETVGWHHWLNGQALRVGHDWATSLSLFTFMHWRRKWQPTPVFLPGESQGWGSLMGFRLWGRTESDTTEVTWQQ